MQKQCLICLTGGISRHYSGCIMLISNIHTLSYTYTMGEWVETKEETTKITTTKPKNVMSKEEEYESKLSFATERMYTLRTCSSKVKTVGKVPWNQDPHLGKVLTNKNASRFPRRKPELWYKSIYLWQL